MLIERMNEFANVSNINFTAKSKNVESVVNTVFQKIAVAKKNNADCYLGTTKHGDNVQIRETLFGKAADLFLSFPEKSKNNPKYKIFHIERVTGKKPSIADDDARKASPAEVRKLKKILDELG